MAQGQDGPPAGQDALIEELVRLVRAKMPGVLVGARSRGLKVTIHVPPGGRRAFVEWPPPVDDVGHP